MLVIRRREGESILIGDDIEIQISEISPSRVKLSVSAPAHVEIMRKELKMTRDQNVASARAVRPDLVRQLAARLRSE